MGYIFKEAWHFPMDVLVKNIFHRNPDKITGVLHEKNKLNETIQRHESDTVVDPMPINEMPIVKLFLSIV